MRVLVATVMAAALLMIAGCAAQGGNEHKVPGEDLFNQHGWKISGPVTENGDKLPADFKLGSGFPWRVYVDLSSDIGLDFSTHPGKEVRVLHFPVADKQGARLASIAATYALQGVTLLDGDEVIGAWLTYTEKDGLTLMGIPGFSLNAKDLEQVTGMSWPAYIAKHSAMPAAPAATADLGAATALVFGGGQTGTVTVTAQSTIRSLRTEIAAAPPVAKPEAAATLFFARFISGDQLVAQLWMLREHTSNDVLAVRFEGDAEWRAVSPTLNTLLRPILDQVPGPKTP